MIEMLVIALLIWLWLIERRLKSVNEAVHALRLDVDGLRAMRTASMKAAADSKATPVPEAPPGLPEVTSLHG